MSFANAIQKHLAKTGGQGDMAFPPVKLKSNVDPLHVVAVRELFIADQVRSYGDKRYKAAKKIVEEFGLLEPFNKMNEGESRELFVTNEFTMNGKLNSSSSMLDATMLQNELVILLGAEKAKKLLAKCSKPKAAPRLISFAEAAK